jgi:C-terminal processing protease CtpA/Prc
MNTKKIQFYAVCLLALTACGGGGSGSNSTASSTSGSSTSSCSVSAQKTYLRSFIDETYLWYKDVPYVNPASYATPQDYFDVLKTPAVTSSGKPVDQFHWSLTTESWNSFTSGIAEDYGIQWAMKSNTPPRNYIVAEIMPDSPAAKAGVRRGDVLSKVDGVDFVKDNTQAGINVLNEGLFPSIATATHQFVFSSASGSKTVSLKPATVVNTTVQNVKTLASSKGTIGYFTFDDHIMKSEAELIDAINTLKAQNIKGLVLDLRYNGGGYLTIANELAYMIAGPASAGKTFERTVFNDKLSQYNESMLFTTLDSSKKPLPYLGLSEVTVIASQGTASASESIINGLRGIDVKVNIVGDYTRGKPYGFYPEDHCGYTYFAVQFKGVNAKGDGDYADGFAPTCLASDDFSHLRGDPAESSLATALRHIETGQCTSTASAAVPRLLRSDAAGRYTLVRPASREMRIMDKPFKP